MASNTATAGFILAVLIPIVIIGFNGGKEQAEWDAAHTHWFECDDAAATNTVAHEFTKLQGFTCRTTEQRHAEIREIKQHNPR